MLFELFHWIRKTAIFTISSKIFIIFATSKRQMMKRFVIFFVAFLSVAIAGAKVSLPQLFQSGMVLQRGKAIPVWGKAEPGETVTVRFNKKEFTTRPSEDEGRRTV